MHVQLYMQVKSAFTDSVTCNPSWTCDDIDKHCNDLAYLLFSVEPESVSNVILAMDRSRVVVSGEVSTASINLLLPRFSEDDGNIG